MSFFKRKKEKVLIPEVNPSGGPGQSSSSSLSGSSNSYSGRGGKKEQPDPDGFEKLPGSGRRVQRDQYNYQPPSRPQQPGGYGNYGNYGSQQQSQPPRGQMQQPPIEGGLGQGPLSGADGQQQQGYGGYEDTARSNLFKNARAPAPSTGAAFDRHTPDGRGGGANDSYGAEKEGDDGEGVLSGNQETEEDDEVEAIKQQIRFTKQESLSATRNAIRTAREAEETAQNTLSKLGQQTDRIANTELALDRAKGYNSRAADGAKQIKQLNQSIFKPSFTFNKASKRDAEEQRILARHLEEKQDREEARQTAYASRERVEQGFREAEKSSTSRFGFNRGGSNNEAESSSAPKTGRAKWEQGGRYQFEASNSDDELEAELDDNLDEIAGLSSRLRILASTAGKEIDAQNKHLDKVSNKVDNLDDKILMNTQYLKRIK